SFKQHSALRGHTLPITCLAVSADGMTLASGAGQDQPAAGELFLWDVHSGKLRRKAADVEKAVRSVAFSPDGAVLAGGVASGVLLVHDAATGERRTSV